MNKQDEIREGVAKIILDWAECKGDAADNYDLSLSILKYLRKNNVVIKVFDSNKKSSFGIKLEPLIKE